MLQLQRLAGPRRSTSTSKRTRPQWQPPCRRSARAEVSLLDPEVAGWVMGGSFRLGKWVQSIRNRGQFRSSIIAKSFLDWRAPTPAPSWGRAAAVTDLVTWNLRARGASKLGIWLLVSCLVACAGILGIEERSQDTAANYPVDGYEGCREGDCT